jgi:hypothetical protein
LHSFYLSFNHPIKKEITEIVSLPKGKDDLWDYFITQL